MLTFVLSGCTMVLEWLDALASEAESAPEAVGEHEPLAANEEDSLPERPPTSTARSETSVITFQSVLENEEMTRRERIHAFENLDPGALQKPVARANVTGAPPARPAERRVGPSEPADWEIAAARKRVPVVMYSTDWCGVCRRARAYFQEKGIQYEEYDVDNNAQARADYELLNPRRSVPTIKIADEIIVGFSAVSVERALDAAARKRLD